MWTQAGSGSVVYTLVVVIPSYATLTLLTNCIIVRMLMAIIGFPGVKSITLFGF